MWLATVAQGGESSFCEMSDGHTTLRRTRAGGSAAVLSFAVHRSTEALAAPANHRVEVYAPDDALVPVEAQDAGSAVLLPDGSGWSSLLTVRVPHGAGWPLRVAIVDLTLGTGCRWIVPGAGPPVIPEHMDDVADPAPAPAPAPGGHIICNDGTRSPSCYACTSGCCSGHGGCR